MDVLLEWRPVLMRHREANVHGVIYAIVPQPVNGLAYIGRAGTSTVAERWRAADKLERIRAPLRAIGWRTSRILVARPQVPKGRRLTKALLADIEKALIYHLRPTLNALEKANPNYHRRLTIENVGAWHFGHRVDAVLT